MSYSTLSIGILLRPVSNPGRNLNGTIPQFSMMTSGFTIMDRISSPLGMSFSSARAIAADIDVSMPAAR